MKSKSPSIEIPQYTAPAKQQFSLPGLGTTSYADNVWGFAEAPEQQAYRLQLETMRNSILKGLGITAPEREASLNQWQDIFTKEALRASMPQLEQTLFSRGLGGSRFYQNAVTDLLSKIATQGVLNREQLSQVDEALKLNQLASIFGMGQTNLSNIGNLMTGAVGQSNITEQQAWKQYMDLLPYLAKVNPGKTGMGGTVGTLAGAGLGFLVGGPAGAAIGSTLGGAAGGYLSGSPSQMDLSWLSMLGGGGGGGGGIPTGATSYGGGSWGMSTPYYPLSPMRY